MIPYLKEEPRMLNLQKRARMIQWLNQYWKSAAAAIAYAPILSLKDILAVFVCQLNAVPSLLVLSHSQ